MTSALGVSLPGQNVMWNAQPQRRLRPRSSLREGGIASRFQYH
jgi:hypothetical protein